MHGEVPHPLSFALQGDPLPLPFPTDSPSPPTIFAPVKRFSTSFRTRSVTEFVGNRVEKASFLVFARREKRSCVVSFVMDELTIFRKKVTVYIVTVKMYT